MADKKAQVQEALPVSEEPTVVYVDLYSTAKHPIPLMYGAQGEESITVPPRGRLKRLNRDWIQSPLPAGLIQQTLQP